MTDPDPAAPLEGSGRHSARERVLARRLLIAVGVVYLVAQLILTSFHRPPAWDESVYISQVTRGANAVLFLPHHARGITFLIAPVTLLGGSVESVRLFLMGLSAIAIVGAFWLWIPLVGIATPIAAFLFSFSWIGIVNGSEVMPNLWAAVFGVVLAGLVARRLEGTGSSDVAIAAGAAAMAFVRPTDATVLTAALAVCILLFRKADRRILVPLCLGLVLGWLPWVVEMSVRFGGPIEAFRTANAAEIARISFGENVVRYLAFADARISISQAHDVPAAALVWWVALIAVAAVSLTRLVPARERTASLLGCFGALALSTEYLVFARVQAPRFLLPAYALASIAAALGLVSLLRARAVARAAGAVVLAGLIPWVIWQGAATDRVGELRSRPFVLRDIGLAMRELADGRPCTFLSRHGFPEIQLASGCDGGILPKSAPTESEVNALLSSGKQAFVVVGEPAPLDSALGSLTPVRVQARSGRVWLIYEIPGPTA